MQQRAEHIDFALHLGLSRHCLSDIKWDEGGLPNRRLDHPLHNRPLRNDAADPGFDAGRQLPVVSLGVV